jgi:allantoin racemase
MRILIVNIPAAEEESSSGHFIKNVLVPLWRRNLDLFKRKDTKIVFRFPSQGMSDEEWADCLYIDRLNPESMFHAIIQAEKEGFDAALITCFHDASTLKAVRPLVSIPVVGIAESSLLMATLTGRKFGFIGISPNPDYKDPKMKEMEQWIAEYDLNKRYVGLKGGCGSGREIEMALTDARHIFELYKKAARELIANGAELILPTCGLLPSIVRLAPGAEKEYPNGLIEVDGVPIMNSFANALKMAEMLVESADAGFRPIKRKRVSAKSVFGASDSTSFWDC